MVDLLPDALQRWQAVEAAAREHFRRSGFGEIRTPLLETTDLFCRGIGEATDVVGSDTAPVREAIRHGENGLLVDFFSPGDLATAVAELLRDRERARVFGEAARETVQRTYELNACVSRHLALINLVASGSIGA